MTLIEKIGFIRELTDSLHDHLADRIDKVPEEWDGNELRDWFAYTAKEQFTRPGALIGARKRDYVNALHTLNI